ncbi:autotransporter outer membrane beta-barrel domain-containing protein [Bartonella sp. TT110JLCBS]|uniref:autotransporter outer membrane beta-barrel domain-containing protein n=1 Tax=Bartonella sp. TT110JLCBS TaxID=3243578 RepID=UPI0035D0A2D3
MHKNLLLCTAACALFFSSFNFTSTSTASGLSHQTRHAIDSISTPTQAEKNLEKIASGAMMQNNAHFNQALENHMDRVRDTINNSFAGASRYGSGAHMNVVKREMDNTRTQAMANKHHKDMQHMLQANAQLDQLRQNRLIKAENLSRGYEKALSDAAKAAAILDADNQQRVNEALQQWVSQDNRNWSELQNKAEILHKAAQVDSALQEHNKELSNTVRKAVLETLNTDGITNVERKGDITSPSSEENKQPLIVSSTRQRRSSDKLPPAHVAAQHKDNSKDNSFTRTDHGMRQPKINENSQSDIDHKTNTTSSASKTTLPSEKAHMNLLPKVGNIATAATESTSKLTDDDDKATATSTSLDGTAKRTILTPQEESSLVMPIAMFAVGFSDVNNQNILLDNMQITMFEPKDHLERSVFLSSYGNKSTFSSKVQEEQDGVQADIRYAALQAGATLIALKDENISSNFGLFGTYGKLSFTPKNKESFQKNMFDKWSLTAYGNIQHDSGIYANAFLSYGIFKENNATALIKPTSKVKNSKTLGAAATVGQKLSTSLEGVILEPQAQLVYQRLMLGSLSDRSSFSDDDNSKSDGDNSKSDGDNSKIDISKPHQWLLRIGGRLTQNKGHALSFYGKLNMIKTFSENFPFAAMESLVEGGFGIQAHLSQNIELHSDLSYQHKLKKDGISAINISAGMRYHF